MLRNRLLRLAKLQAGEHVLDLGAGTGLIAREARLAVGPSGRVLALDVSHPALGSWVTEPTETGNASPTHGVVADAHVLPLRDRVVDVVLARAVLLYLADRGQAAREMVRVLRPGGRIVVFEPINGATLDFEQWWGLDPTLFPPEHGDVNDYMQAHWPHRESALSLSEQELADHFRVAGCVRVRANTLLSYRGGQRVTVDRARTWLSQPPHPGTPSYEQSARAVLGARASQHIESVAQLIASRPLTFAYARVMLQAWVPQSDGEADNEPALPHV